MVATVAEDVVVILPPMIKVHQTQLYVKYASNQNILLENDITILIFLIRTNDATHGSLALKAYQQNLYLEYYY